MQYTVAALYKHLFQGAYDVYEVFKHHFKEDFVDLQINETEGAIRAYLLNSSLSHIEDTWELNDEEVESIAAHLTNPVIMVWWPQVVVTNENAKSILIQDLYAKIEITPDGKIPMEYCGFKLNRSTYSELQFTCNYLHSHVNGIPKTDPSIFKEPCLGTGPIRETITTLKMNHDEVTWMLFCQELSLYVITESISGVPYHRLESVGDSSRKFSDHRFHLNVGFPSPYEINMQNWVNFLSDFTVYYLQYGHLSFNFTKGAFVCGMDYYHYMVDISNSFIEYYNSHKKECRSLVPSSDDTPMALYNKNIIFKVIVANNNFYLAESPTTCDLSNYEGKHVCTFKGKDITLHICKAQEKEERNEAILLSNNIAMYILKSILKVINYRYANNYDKQTNAPTYKRVIYI